MTNTVKNSFLFVAGLSMLLITGRAAAAWPAEPGSSDAAHTPYPAETKVAQPAPSVMIITPEKIGVDWYWYRYADTDTTRVQSRIERHLRRAGFEVLSIAEIGAFPDSAALEDLLDRARALEIAREAGADYLILGRASAVRQSHDTAYGVDVYRYSAGGDIRIVEVGSGTLVGDASGEAVEGNQSPRTAGRDALKALAKKLAGQIERQMRELARTYTPPAEPEAGETGGAPAAETAQPDAEPADAPMP